MILKIKHQILEKENASVIEIPNALVHLIHEFLE